VLNLSFWYKQTGRTWVAIAVTGTGLAVTLALCALLIPRVGYAGAAWARLACEAAMVVLSLWLNQHYCRTPYDFRRMGLYIITGAAIYAAGLWTSGLPAAAMYALNAVMLCGFGGLVIWKEKLWKQIWRSK
jgi:O-antigen/teichoic acid export membrane protein